MSDRFQLVSPYSPAGDQPNAIEKLSSNFEAGVAKQTLHAKLKRLRLATDSFRGEDG